MAVVFSDWLNGNEQRAYPINELATKLASNGQLLPDNFLVDANVCLPRSAGRYIYVSSVAVTPSLVSIALLASESSAFCSAMSSSSSSGSPGFVPIAVLSLTRPLTLFKNYKITPLYPGVGGWVAFGSGANANSPFSLLFNGPDATQLVDHCVRAYNDLPVLSLGKVNVSTKLTGLVRLRGKSGVMKTFKATRVINGVGREVAVIGLDLTNSPVTTLQDFAGPCGHRPQAQNCKKTPITSINDATPDCNGNIDIEFVGDQSIGDTGDGIIIDLPVGLNQACQDQGFKKSPLETTDVCGTPSSSSSSSSESSSSTPVPPSSSSSSVSSEYCEHFESGLGELTVKHGVFTIQLVGPNNRLVSQAGNPGEQYAVDLKRFVQVPSTGDTYIIKGTVSPRISNGEGHLIFGWATNTNFYFAGLTLNASPSFPNGQFFVGHRSAVGPSWPAALGFGYNFVAGAQFVPPAPLVFADYRVIVQITRLSPTLVSIHLKATWNDPIARQIDQTVVVPASFFATVGRAGLGVVGSETEFDDFGINCGGSSSSL